MKKNNPTIPILVREAQGTIPKVYARYGTTLLRTRKIGVGNLKLMAATTDFGTEKSQSLEGLSDKQVEDAVAGLVKDGP
jgi:NADH dehydrogenase (ubiquinone) 1 alpha subcomplex subunit 2